MEKKVCMFVALLFFLSQIKSRSPFYRFGDIEFIGHCHVYVNQLQFR